jgi:methionyl aminopeptidase
MHMHDMEDYDYNTLKEVGKVSYEALQYSKTVVKEGRKLIEIAEEIENFIKKKGFEMAFPVNLSINENAAHYTPTADDSYVLSGKETIKVDVGARKDAYLGDCAITIDLSQHYSKLVEATEEALSNAISLVRAGRPVNEIGKVIEKTAEAKGFKPIRNLGGHGIERLTFMQAYSFQISIMETREFLRKGK